MLNRHRVKWILALLVLAAGNVAVADESLDQTFVQVSGDPLEAALQSLPPAVRKGLRDIVLEPSFAGVIDAKRAEGLCRDHRIDMPRLMQSLVPLAQLYSRPPITKYRVGCVVRGQSGALYLGANLEVPKQNLGASVHAEQSAVANAFMNGEKGLSALAVSAAPCGHCRQFLNEIVHAQDLEVFIPEEPPTKLKELLPRDFGPQTLGSSERLFKSSLAEIALHEPRSDLAKAALDAAKKSYAPYSKSPSGIAVRLRSGEVYAGAYLENVAFNPSLSPLQVACVQVVFRQRQLSDISEVVLVERIDAPITQQPTTRDVLTVLSPEASLKVDNAETKSAR